MAEVIAAFAPAVMALEQLYSHYQRPRTAILMGHARGVICLAAAEAGIPVVHYSATQVKKILTGAGRAGKAQVQRAIQRELGLPSSPSPPTWPTPWPSPCVTAILRIAPGNSNRRNRPLITKITGQLIALEENVLALGVGAFEYEILIPEFTRRQLQGQIGQEISLHTVDYLEGNPMQGRMTPRLIGFLSEIEREFFDLFCSVDGVGVKKALRAMVRPVKEVATAIEEQDATLLSALPGIGPAMSERIIAKLRRKVPKFALMVAQQEVHEAEVESDVVVETFEVLRRLGHSESDARKLLDAALSAKKKYADVQGLLQAIYQQSHK